MIGHRPDLRGGTSANQELLRRAAAVLTKAGEHFLPAVVQEVAMVLDAELAYVGEFTDSGRVQTLAAWQGGQLVENFDYALDGTPCHDLIAHRHLCITNDLRAAFPDAPCHAEINAQAYVGVLLVDAKGNPLGVLAAISARPFTSEPHGAALLPLFAGRLSADIERQRTERELRKSEEHLRQVQRVEAIGRLAGGIAHDFNNLLMIVIGYAEILRERQSSPELTELLSAATRATTLTRQLLAFGRRQVLQVQRVSINEVVSDVEAMLTGVIGGHIRLFASLDPDLPAVEADRGQLEQVLVNLAINARDAMPDGGTLRIETTIEQVETAHYQMPPGTYVCLSVSDTGVGMAPEVLAHIFEPFYTTKGNRGSGLGLSSVYGIVKQTGGYIWCRSDEGRGTTFQVYFRPAAAPVSSERPIDTVVEPVESGAERILVVDDEPGVRQLLTRILRGRGYSVLEADDGVAALATFANSAEPIDLVITDIVMPGMNGIKLAEEIRARQVRQKLLFVSGYPPGAKLASSTVASSVPVLAKPFTPARLTIMVRTLLDAPTISSPSRA